MVIKRLNSAGGVTLVEVMVAMAVMAIAALRCFGSIPEQTDTHWQRKPESLLLAL